MGGISFFRSLQKELSSAQTDQALLEAIVNAPFRHRVEVTKLDLGIIVLLLVDPKTKLIDRVALSDTEQAAGAVKMSEKPFHDIKIPLGYESNLIARVIKTGKPQSTTDWKYLFVPDLSPRAARFNQAGAGIECSYVYPLTARSGGALIFSYYQACANIGETHQSFMERYIRLVNDRLKLPRG